MLPLHPSEKLALAAALVMSLLCMASASASASLSSSSSSFPRTKSLALLAFSTTPSSSFSFLSQRQNLCKSDKNNWQRRPHHHHHHHHPYYYNNNIHPLASRVTNGIVRKMSSSDQQQNDDAKNKALSISSTSTSMSISSRMLQTLDPCVVLMKQIISQHASKWENDPRGIFSLAQGVVHWRPPKSAYEALSRAVQDNFGDDDGDNGDGRLIHTYCPDEGYPPLLSALKEKLQTEKGLNDPHVMVTSGANQAYINCVLTLLDESDKEGNISKCVVFEPYYFNHVMAVQSSRGGQGCGGTKAAASTSTSSASTTTTNVEGLLVGPTIKGVPDLDWLRSQLEENKYHRNENENINAGNNAIRMVTLVNPGNPTGVSLPYEFLEEITLLTKEYGVWLVMDNTYEHFDVKSKNKLPTITIDNTDDSGNKIINTSPEYPCFDQEHVINIFSFSKGYAMAGFRVGYIALSSKNGNAGAGTKAYEEMLKVQDTIAICTSRISQMAALGALEAGREWVYEQVKTLDVGRSAILEAISSLEEVIGGDGAMYVMGKLPDGVDDQKFASSLVEHYGVCVIPGSFCGLPGWIRVCYSNLPPDDCKIAAARLKKGILELTAE